MASLLKKVISVLTPKKWGFLPYARAFFKDYDPKRWNGNDGGHAAWLQHELKHPELFDLSDAAQLLHLSEAERDRYHSVLSDLNSELGGVFDAQLNAKAPTAFTVKELTALNRDIIAALVKSRVRPSLHSAYPSVKQKILAAAKYKMRIPVHMMPPPKSAACEFILALSVLNEIGVLAIGLLTSVAACTLTQLLVGMQKPFYFFELGPVVMTVTYLGLFGLRFAARKLLTIGVSTELVNEVSDDWDTVLSTPSDANTLLLAMMVPHNTHTQHYANTVKSENFSGWSPKEVMQWLIAKNQFSSEDQRALWAPCLDTVLIDVPKQLCEPAVDVHTAPTFNPFDSDEAQQRLDQCNLNEYLPKVS